MDVGRQGSRLGGVAGRTGWASRLEWARTGVRHGRGLGQSDAAREEAGRDRARDKSAGTASGGKRKACRCGHETTRVDLSRAARPGG